jgi:hypothetical protein
VKFHLVPFVFRSLMLAGLTTFWACGVTGGVARLADAWWTQTYIAEEEDDL